MRAGPGFRLLAALMCGMFLLSVAVQWNDPDPWLWMPVYGLVNRRQRAAFS